MCLLELAKKCGTLTSPECLVSWLRSSLCSKKFHSLVLLNISMDYSSSAMAVACTIRYKKRRICRGVQARSRGGSGGSIEPPF